MQGRVSTLAASPISTFVRPYVPCTQVDIGLAARVDTRPCTPSSVGFVYVLTMVRDLTYTHQRMGPNMQFRTQYTLSKVVDLIPSRQLGVLSKLATICNLLQMVAKLRNEK